MAGRLSVGTSSLTDLERERLRGERGPAHALLAAGSDTEPFRSAVAPGEFAEGFDDPDHPVLRAVREHHTVLPVGPAVALVPGALTRGLRGRGRLIGSNDLRIVATSLGHERPPGLSSPAAAP